MATRITRRQTKIDQKNAKVHVHPRRLARSVARFINRKRGRKESWVRDFRSVTQEIQGIVTPPKKRVGA